MKSLIINTTLDNLEDGVNVVLYDDDLMSATVWIDRYTIHDGITSKYVLMMYNHRNDYIGLINFDSVEMIGKTASEVIE